MHCTTPPNFNKPQPSSCETLHIHIVDIYIYIYLKKELWIDHESLRNHSLLTQVHNVRISFKTVHKPIHKQTFLSFLFILLFSRISAQQHVVNNFEFLSSVDCRAWRCSSRAFSFFLFFFLKVSKLFYLSTEHLPNKNTIWALEVNWFKAVLNY